MNGFGAQSATPGQNVVLTQEVVDAANGVITYFQNNPCTQASVPEVATFQGAYNRSGLPGQLTVDGQYGGNSEAAMDTVANAAALSAGVPSNCFGGTIYGNVPPVPVLDQPGPGPAPAPAPAPVVPAPSTNVTVTSGTSSAVAWIIGGAIVLAAGIAGWAWYAKGGGKQMLVRKGARRKLRRIKRARRK